MDCRKFEQSLADYQQGALTPRELADAERHLAACRSCQILADVTAGRLNLLRPAEHQALTRSILNETSGPACGRVHDLLCDFVDSELGELESALVRQHLENCPGCHTLATTLIELGEILPTLAGIQPEPAVLEAILQETVVRHKFQASLQTRMLAWWNRLVQRPRFSLEAAYVGTLALVFAFGNPFPVMRALSVRSMETVSSLTAGLTAREKKPGLIKSMESLAVDVSDREAAFRKGIEDARIRGESVVSGSLQSQVRTLRACLSWGQGAIHNLWNKVRSDNRKRGTGKV